MRFTATAFTAALLAGSAQALFGKKPPAVKPHLVEGFQWKNPYAEDNTVEGFTAACEHIQSFPGKQYTLNDLVEHFPDGLRPWSTGLKKFFTGKEYPGSWSGYDRHGLDRALVLLDYDTVPLAVREWIEESQRSGAKEHALFAVFDKVEDEETILEDIIHFPSTSEVDRSKDSDKVVIFAPGALYHVLPLWVAADSQCQDAFSNLANYKPKPEDGGVVAWLDHKKPKNHEMEFKIQVQSLKSKVASSQESATRVEL